MRILILNRDYPRFLLTLYSSRPELASAPYAEQMAARNASLFGVADFYSHALRQRGQDALDVHVNNGWLQSAWAQENGLTARVLPPPSIERATRYMSVLKGFARRALLSWARRFAPRQIDDEELRILAAQVESFAPDVLLNQDMSYVRTARLARIVPRRIKIVGQIAAALPIGEDLGRYDLIVSSLPNFVARFRSLGVNAALNALAFDPRVLERMGAPAARDVPVSFVGSVSADHIARLRLLESVARRVPLKIWGSGVEELPLSSPLRSCYQGEAWGVDMFAVLRRSRITINHHIDLAEGHCNNMRMYEATGCGTLMVVDRGRNLLDLFDPGREVLAYSSAEECVREIERALADDALRAEIAAAGQRRTLADHTYERRAGELIELFEGL